MPFKEPLELLAPSRFGNDFIGQTGPQQSLLGCLWFCSFLPEETVCFGWLVVCLVVPLLNLKSNFSFNSIAQKPNEIFCPMKLGKNFVKYFARFLGNGVSKKMLLRFIDL